MKRSSKAITVRERNAFAPQVFRNTTSRSQDSNVVHSVNALYRWHSEERRKEAHQNFECALIAAEKNMPAQAEVRYSKALEIYDTDKVEKAICQARDCHPKAKLFAVTDNVYYPIVVQGESHLWAGQLLSEQFTLQRDDQLIPKEVMARLDLLALKGLHFADGYALFSPYQPYELPKKVILAEQCQLLKRDFVRMIRSARSMITSGGKMARSFASTVSSIKIPIRIPDPVLAGVIQGSLAHRRYFFIELGRWIHSD